MPTILIDTREQRPYGFSPELPTRRATLAVGDYTLAGHEDQVAVERKSLDDLLGSITSGRERFKRELVRLRAFRFAALVVEADWPQIEAGAYRSKVHPNAVFGSLLSFALKYGVTPILAGDRETAARITERLLILYARQVERDAAAIAKPPQTPQEAPDDAGATQGRV